MNKRERIESVMICVAFACYILFLLKLLFLSRVSLADLTDGQRMVERSVNLIPFQSIKAFVLGESFNLRRFAFSNVVGNVLIFVPMGACLALLRKDKRVLSNLLIVFCLSLLTEAIQGVLGIGAADIDDIMLNTLGGLTGILGYRLFLLILRAHRRVRTAFAVLSLLALPMLLYYTFWIKLRL